MPCDFAAASSRRKSLIVPKSRWHAPLWPPPCHCASRWPTGCRRRRAGGRGVVLPLAERGADRMDRRQIQNVEAHLGDVRQPGLAIGKRAMPTRRQGWSSAETFRTTRSIGPTADRPLSAIPVRKSSAIRRSGYLSISAANSASSAMRARAARSASSSRVRPIRSTGRHRRRAGAIGRFFNQSGADRQIDRHVVARGNPFFEIVPPRGKVIDPAADGVVIRAESHRR